MGQTDFNGGIGGRSQSTCTIRRIIPVSLLGGVQPPRRDAAGRFLRVWWRPTTHQRLFWMQQEAMFPSRKLSPIPAASHSDARKARYLLSGLGSDSSTPGVSQVQTEPPPCQLKCSWNELLSLLFVLFPLSPKHLFQHCFLISNPSLHPAEP
jgi:hypothetical protein